MANYTKRCRHILLASVTQSKHPTEHSPICQKKIAIHNSIVMKQYNNNHVALHTTALCPVPSGPTTTAALSPRSPRSPADAQQSTGCVSCRLRQELSLLHPPSHSRSPLSRHTPPVIYTDKVYTDTASSPAAACPPETVGRGHGCCSCLRCCLR